MDAIIIVIFFVFYLFTSLFCHVHFEIDVCYVERLNIVKMTKVAAAGQLPSSNALHFGGGGGGVGSSKVATTTALKRKTPSELRVIS